MMWWRVTKKQFWLAGLCACLQTTVLLAAVMLILAIVGVL